MIHVENMLKKIAQENSKAKIFAIYDCCRIKIEGIKGLAGILKGKAEQIEYCEEDKEDEYCRYFHITACQPGGIAEADADFAKRIFAHSLKYYQREPIGFV